MLIKISQKVLNKIQAIVNKFIQGCQRPSTGWHFFKIMFWKPAYFCCFTNTSWGHFATPHFCFSYQKLKGGRREIGIIPTFESSAKEFQWVYATDCVLLSPGGFRSWLGLWGAMHTSRVGVSCSLIVIPKVSGSMLSLVSNNIAAGVEILL